MRASPVLKKEIILVHDGSSDGTAEVRDRKSRSRIDILFITKKSEKGAAIHSGVAAITGGILVIQDTDLEYEPADVKKSRISRLFYVSSEN